MSNMVVRTNVMSLNSHRNLGMTGALQARSAARLSSGFRINSAADDAAGLAISEKMRSQIRGLDQASRNAQDGISLIQTAEGAMQTINEMVTRIRELVIQAANDTNAHDGENLPQSDRMQIQREINQLLEEIDQVTLRTEFNTRTLLDGSLSAAGQPIISEEMRFEIGQFLSVNSGAVDDLNATLHSLSIGNQHLNNLQAELAFLQAAETQINALTTDAAVQGWLDGLQSSWLAHAARVDAAAVVGTPSIVTNHAAQADWINARAREHFGLDASVNFVLAADLAEGIDTLRFDAVGGLTTVDGTGAPVGPATGDITTLASLQNAMWENRHPNGNWGTLDGQWGAGNIVAGLPGDLTDLPPGTAAPVDFAAAQARIGLVNGHILDTLGQIGILTGHEAAARGVLDNLVQTHNVIGEQFRSFADMMAAFEYEGTDGSLWFQIGANQGQGIFLSIEAVNVGELHRVAAGHTLTVEGFNIADLRNVDLEDGVGVMHSHGSIIDQFTSALDAALAHVTGQRAHLGAVQNRLEFTIENLDTASENLQASNSRIRDADMAKEMMRFTQANVLQQAAISMLAQANMAPQNILQLLG